MSFPRLLSTIFAFALSTITQSRASIIINEFLTGNDTITVSNAVPGRFDAFDG
jgi:hypothetical protein